MSTPANYEKHIEITKYELLAELPDPFLFNDGTRVSSRSDWARRRDEIYHDVVELQYGTMPPKPEIMQVEPIYFGNKGRLNCYRITTGTKAKPIIFTMYVFKANCEEKAPAVISGDMCFSAAWETEKISALLTSMHCLLFLVM